MQLREIIKRLPFNFNRTALSFTFLLIGSIVFANATIGNPVLRFKQTQKIQAVATGDTDFVSDVDISGDTAIFGVPYETINGVTLAGAAHVYVRTGGTWTLQQKLATGNQILLGWRVKIDGDTALVASVNEANERGAVYVYVRSGGVWIFQQRLIASDAATEANIYFGWSLAIEGNTLVVGAYRGTVNATGDVGKAYVFTRSGTTWTQQAILTGSDAVATDRIGTIVGLSGDTIIVGGVNNIDIPGQTTVGKAYVFTRSGTTWTQQQKLVATSGIGGDRRGFGASVAIVGDTAFVGAFAQTSGSENFRGAVYVFNRSGATWTQSQELRAADGGAQDQFGYRLAVSGERLAVGAPGDSVNGKTYEGSASVFVRNNVVWTEQQKLISTDGRGPASQQIPRGFAQRIGISGSTVIAATTKLKENYIFDRISVKTTPFDFNDDGKADISVFTPGSGIWYAFDTQNNILSYHVLGNSTDKLAPADYDGDGRTDFAVFRNGTWMIQRSSQGYFVLGFGADGDVPQPADTDGDGSAELVVYRPSHGIWYAYNLVTTQITGVQFGGAADKPVIGDYDGDGKADYAVARHSGGGSTWYILGSTQGFYGLQFGADTDRLVPADYDNDGKTDVAVFRPSTGVWYLQRSTAGFTGIQWGASDDALVPADYDGDGKTDVAVFRPSTSIWYILNSGSNQPAYFQFGQSTDKPVQSTFVF